MTTIWVRACLIWTLKTMSEALLTLTATAAAAMEMTDEIREQFRPPTNTLFLHEKQMEVFKHPARFKVVVAGRRWGKSQLSKVCLIKFARKKRRLIWYVAPSYRMAKQIMWPELVDAIPRSWVKKYNETILTITLVNGSKIELKGADNPDSLRGVGIHYLVMDEYQDIDPEAWVKVLRPTLASTGGHALFIGCVNEKTKVLKQSGAVPIESMSIGSPDKTLDSADISLYGLDRSFHKADGFWNNGVVETRQIKTHMGFEIESSLPHPIWTIDEAGNQGWKKTEDIRAGDRIAIARGMEVWGDSDPLDGLDEHMATWHKQFDGKPGRQVKELT